MNPLIFAYIAGVVVLVFGAIAVFAYNDWDPDESAVVLTLAIVFWPLSISIAVVVVAVALPVMGWIKLWQTLGERRRAAIERKIRIQELAEDPALAQNDTLPKSILQELER